MTIMSKRWILPFIAGIVSIVIGYIGITVFLGWLPEENKGLDVEDYLEEGEYDFEDILYVPIVKEKRYSNTAWEYYTFDDLIKIGVPPSLELRTDKDLYTYYQKYIIKSNLPELYDVVFQQKGLSDMTPDVMKDYCRVLINTAEIEPGLKFYEITELTKYDIEDFRDLVVQNAKPYNVNFIKEPDYKWLDINGTKALVIDYIREGSEGAVICHIYHLYNYDKMCCITTAYRQSYEGKWADDIDNVIRTFEWVHPIK